ncbi:MULTISPECIES: hypothetical protein [unclassified Pedobacter]|uniref:hypothetical protein n=1 Tax=unclassified Pedobacter TaxID=2628915 RepID=UPI001420BED9|nr:MULTISPECIES: hypothetical protein [unclassified Pedobacter]NII81526.1 hypothetical protein [Pedobacter sp. SG908]NMN35530.1 hypothetical protein [Pedobacter sp. SG918]
MLESYGEEIYAYGSNSDVKTARIISFKVQHLQDYGIETGYYSATNLNNIRIRYAILVTPGNGLQPITFIKIVKPIKVDYHLVLPSYPQGNLSYS